MTNDNPSPPSSARLQKPVRVLVVDDHVESADVAAMTLEDAGCLTCVAYTAEQALDLAPGFEPDVVLLDLSLTGRRGYELAEAFRSHEKLQRCRLVALTVHANEAARRRSEAVGFHAHLTKPYSVDALLEAVANEDDRPTLAPRKKA